MLKKAPFVHKLLDRLDKLSSREVRKCLEDLSSENTALDQILESLEEGILIFDEKGTIEHSNFQARQWLTAQNEKSGLKSASDLSDPNLSAWIKKQHKNLKGKITETFSLLAPREIKLRGTLSPLGDSKDRRTVLILSPVINRESEALQEMTHLASMVRLSAGIAHEIGNPLNSIGIHLELLKKHCDGIPESKKKNIDKHLSVIRTETGRLDHIVKNFLSATRRPPLRFKPENINTLLEGALSFLDPELKQNHVEVRFFSDSGLPECLVDKERLHQVFINLIKNAMEAVAPKGKGHLEIRVTHRSKALWLTFKDDGVGIGEKDLPHIFEAYFTTKEKGSGLGLMTVYHIVREHGGRIEVASRPGKGSEFTIILPIRQPKLQLPEPKK